MQFQGAVIEEQGVTFGILIVKPHVLNDATRRDALVSEGSRLFGGIPTVLMAQASNGRPRYYGRSDISKFMAAVPIAAIPWKKYTINR